MAPNEFFGYLAENNLAAAAETAEKRLGQSAMGKHAVTARGQEPGRERRRYGQDLRRATESHG